MEFRAGDLVQMNDGDTGHRGLFLVLRLDKDGAPVVQVLRPRSGDIDYVGEVSAFYAIGLAHVIGRR